MTENQKEIITWLCNPSPDKYLQGLALIQKYHQNKSIVRNFSGLLTQDKKDKIQYELCKLAGYTFTDFQQKKWMLDNPALSGSLSEVEGSTDVDLQSASKNTDPLCPDCNQPYTPQEGADPLCPDCLKKKQEAITPDPIPETIIQDTLQNPSPETIINPEVKEQPKPETGETPIASNPLPEAIPGENQPRDATPVPDPKKPAAKKSNPQTQPDPNLPSSPA